MPRTPKVTPKSLTAMKLARDNGATLRKLAKDHDVSESTVSRMLSKKRVASDYKGATPAIQPGKHSNIFSWDLESIRTARDLQMSGNFFKPVRLAEAFRTNDSLFTAYLNRIAPQSAVEAKLIPHPSARGRALARKLECSVSTPRTVLKGLHGTLANHGLAIGYVVRTPNDAGTVVDMTLTEWPLEFVRWYEYDQTLKTRTLNGPDVDIIHGDGTWIVFRKFKDKPWTQDAALLPASFIWAAHGNGISDWASASTSHGQSKVMSTMPEGISMQLDESGNLAPEAEGMLATLQAVMSGSSAVGILPYGSVTEFLSNGSTAWQVFKELILNREKAAARIYLGTDATLGAAGGAPGVDISTLFGVSSTILQGDFGALEDGLYTGLYVPWTAINNGDSTLAPMLKYQLPDPDSEGKSVEKAAKLERLMLAIQKLKEQGFNVDQEVVEGLARDFGVIDVPQLAKVSTTDLEQDKLAADAAKAGAEANKAGADANKADVEAGAVLQGGADGDV